MSESQDDQHPGKVIPLNLQDSNAPKAPSPGKKEDRRTDLRLNAASPSRAYSVKVVTLLFGLLALIMLASANLQAIGTPESGRFSLNLLALAAGCLAVGIAKFPWHRFDRYLLGTPLVLAAGFVATAEYYSGGWGSPLASFYILLAVMSAILLSTKLTAVFVIGVLLLSMIPQLYAPDAGQLAQHHFIWAPVTLILAFVAWHAANHWIPADYDHRLQRTRELKDLFEREAYTDRLTNLSNRAFFEDRLEEETKRVRRLGGNFSLIFMDVDDFKQVNDAHGHRTGDRALRLVARVLRQNARQIDIVARYGGDEFAILMPGTSLVGARNFFERIKEEIAERSERTLGFTVCLSAGNIRSSRDCSDYRDLLEAVDDAMYVAKGQGKNRLLTVAPLESEEAEWMRREE
ncbi:hypothetical protein BH23PAT1_BH23PAT1_0630 [soil metagenome]